MKWKPHCTNHEAKESSRLSLYQSGVKRENLSDISRSLISLLIIIIIKTVAP
jgi:hypothetical protein